MGNETLSNCFDIEDAKKELSDIKTRVEESEKYGDPNLVLRLNIGRAERLLDKIELECSTGASNLTARLIEIAAGLINAVTSAANSMIANDVSMETTNQKQEYLDLKKLEFELKKNKDDGKKAIGEGQQGQVINNTQNNLYVGSREEMLELLSKNRELEKLN